MEGVYYQQRLDEGVNLYLIKEPKFKTVWISLFLYRQLDENTTKNALLPYVIKRGNQDYQDLKAIEKFLGEKYGATLSVDVVKKGDLQLLYFNSNVISDKYTLNGEGVVSAVLSFILDLIRKPFIGDNGFKEEFFGQEKQNLRKLISARINDKIQYSLERCYEEMYKGRPFSRYRYGDIEELDQITSRELADYYYKLLSETPIDIFVVGDVDISDLKDVLDRGLEINRQNILYPMQEQYNPDRDVPREVVEAMDVNQGKLVMGFKTGVDYKSAQYVPMLVYTSILGGGTHSKLFNNVREKASLAYYSFARMEKFKGLMVIGSGIETTNYQKTVQIINQQLEEMNKGNISEYEIDGAKKALVNDILSMKDNQAQTVDFLLNRIISGHGMTPQTLIKEIERVTVQEVREVSGKVEPVVTYFLTSTKSGGGEMNDGQYKRISVF